MPAPFPFPTLGILAPSSPVPEIELGMAVEWLESLGFVIRIAPQTYKRHLYFSGTDSERAKALFDFASDPTIDIIWCARGGYGANRLLPYLDQMTREKGPPRRKLFLGYSDATSLLEYTRTRWNFKTLHAPMPALKTFTILKKSEILSFLDPLSGKAVPKPIPGKLSFLCGSKPRKKIEGQLLGGNLAVWNTLLGTPWQNRSQQPQILFFEEVGESLPRIDRMFQHLDQAGGFQRCAGIILGDFTQCPDGIPKVLAKRPKNSARLRAPMASDLKPLRAEISLQKGLQGSLQEIALKHGFPVFWKMPAGHGPNFHALPLGATVSVSTTGEFKVLRWK